MLELFGMSSPNVRKILIALEEMALPYDVRHVAVFRGAQFDEAFVAMNPMAKVPVLVDCEGPARGEPIFESGAILVYLAETYAPRFLPASGPERYRVLKWLFMQVANVGPVLGNHGHFRSRADELPEVAARFRRQAAQAYRALDRRLGEAPWLGGDAYSIADMAVHPWARRFAHFGMDEGACPHLREWVDRIARRPAVLASDAVIKRLGEQDTLDRQVASAAEMAMFTGQHIEAPSAEAASGIPPWWNPASKP